jgi:hypothetical protein
MWERAQRCLRAHLKESGRTERAKCRKPLAEKVFHDRGILAKKGSKRWRYYLSEAALHGEE